MTLPNFSEVMKIRREWSGLSFRRLARLTNLSPTTVQLAEKGGDIKMSTAVKIAGVLGIKVELVIEGSSYEGSHIPASRCSVLDMVATSGPLPEGKQ